MSVELCVTPRPLDSTAVSTGHRENESETDIDPCGSMFNVYTKLSSSILRLPPPRTLPVRDAPLKTFVARLSASRHSLTVYTTVERQAAKVGHAAPSVQNSLSVSSTPQ